MRALLLPLAAALLSPDATTSLQHEALSSSHARAIVQSLCDEVGPRLAGSPGDKAAVAWALRTMPALGLSHVRAEHVMVTHWERGAASAELVSPVAQSMAVAALGGSVGTGPRGVEADVVEVADYKDLEKLGADAVKGKIVFLDPIMRRARDGAGYGEVVRNRHIGAREAAKLGAVAMLLRSCGTDHDRLPHTGAKGKDDHEIPAAAISVPDAEMLHRVLAEKKAARVKLVLGSKTLPDAPSANVVGEVPGREKPQEVVLIGAHLDSWDLGTGAVDDGAGVAIALETGRLIAAMPTKPRRTVRVVLFANEEHGLEGAKEYARAHAGELGLHVAALEADFGADVVYAVRWRGGPEAQASFDEITRALLPLGIGPVGSVGEAGADVSPLLAAGVPIVDLRQDGTRYFDLHHSANDTVDKIDPAAIAQAAAAFATATWAAAEMEGTLGRVPEAARQQRW